MTDAERMEAYGDAYFQDLSPEQLEAVEGSVAGGVVAYLHRLVAGHEFRFHWDAYHDRVGVSVCPCGDPMCHLPHVRLHLNRLISDYERKAEEFAVETRRADSHRAEVEQLRAVVAKARGHIEVMRDYADPDTEIERLEAAIEKQQKLKDGYRADLQTALDLLGEAYGSTTEAIDAVAKRALAALDGKPYREGNG